MTSGFRVPASTLHIVIVLAMALSLLVVRASHSPSHDLSAIASAQLQRHVELAAVSSEHDHVHDDGGVPEQELGHHHGHNPGDHSHETAGLVAKLILVFGPAAGSFSLPAFRRPDPGDCPRLERPPKSVSKA